MSILNLLDLTFENEQVFNDIFKNGLLNKYTIQRVNIEEYWKLFYKNFTDIEPVELNFIREDLLTESDKEKRNKLKMLLNSYHVENNLVVRDGKKVIALFRSEQKDIDVYYMRHAIVDQDYRNLGIYEDYLKKITKFAERIGFMQIVSCFVAAYNDIYKIKIKHDFYVTSVENNADYGSIVWITKYLNEDLKRAFFFRSGIVDFSKNLFNNSEKNAKKLLNKLKDCSN